MRMDSFAHINDTGYKNQDHPGAVHKLGDGDNDIALFQSAVIKIAVGNATEKLKAAADDVVASFEDDGFVQAMQKYVFVDK